MKINDDKKIDILLAALNERYKSIHIIRDRVQNLTLWILGGLLTSAGWLIQIKTPLAIEQKSVFTFFILLAFSSLRFLYLRDLEKGFKSQMRTLVKIEETLGLYGDPPLNEQIYPKEWKEAGTTKKEGNFFTYSYIIIEIGIFILLSSIWLRVK